MKLTFDPGAHAYFLDGAAIPSVTSILAPLTDFRFVAPEVLHAAAAFGQAVHRACELDDLGQLDEATLDEPLVPYLAQWRQFCAEHDCQWDGIEKRVYHPVLRYAGTLDRLGRVDGVPTVVDIKTSTSLYPAYGPQTAAYARTQAQPELLARVVVQLTADAYTVKRYTDSADWPVFCSLLTLHNWCGRYRVTPLF